MYRVGDLTLPVSGKRSGASLAVQGSQKVNNTGPRNPGLDEPTSVFGQCKSSVTS